MEVISPDTAYTRDSDLYDWQRLVIDQIEAYEEFAGAELMQNMSNFEQNCHSLIQFSLRKGSGHTFLTGYIAKKYATAVVHFGLDHYKEIEMLAGARIDDIFHQETSFISVLEMRHDMLLSSKQEWINTNLDKIKIKFQNKQVIVIDQASDIRVRCPEIVDFICQISQNAAIVLLG